MSGGATFKPYGEVYVVQGQLLDGGIVYYCPSSAAAMLMSDPREAMQFSQRSAAVATVRNLKRIVREQGLAAMRFTVVKTIGLVDMVG